MRACVCACMCAYFVCVYAHMFAYSVCLFKSVVPSLLFPDNSVDIDELKRKVAKATKSKSKKKTISE